MFSVDSHKAIFCELKSCWYDRDVVIVWLHLVIQEQYLRARRRWRWRKIRIVLQFCFKLRKAAIPRKILRRIYLQILQMRLGVQVTQWRERSNLKLKGSPMGRPTQNAHDNRNTINTINQLGLNDLTSVISVLSQEEQADIIATLQTGVELQTRVGTYTDGADGESIYIWYILIDLP